MRPQPFFLDAPHVSQGQRLCVYHAPQGPAIGRVVYVHPFAEELNKSRRMAALQSRALAQAGYAVLQIDLLGCGDSSGDFGDATWDRWVDDVVVASRWLASRHSGQPPAPLWLWGLRAGTLLCVDAARRLEEPSHFLFWQPATAGKALLQQFLRLRVAGELASGRGKALMDEMREQIAAGHSIEVAGYTLGPGLCQGLERATLRPSPIAGRLEWFEVSARDDAALSPAGATAASQWRQSGWQVRTHVVAGPAFWQTTEIEDAPHLLSITTQALTVP